MEPKATGIQNGSCIFFKKFQTTAHPKKNLKYEMKNLAYGVLLGHVPPFGKGPTVGDVYRALGAIGYVGFDDVAEFLGPEMGAKCLEEFEKKYINAPAEVAPPVEAPISGLLGADGKPIAP